MTGRRLYEIVCDERYEHFHPRFEQGASSLAVNGKGDDEFPVAWAYLVRSERLMWNAIAKRLPKPPRAPKKAPMMRVLTFGGSKVQAIKEIRAHTGLGLYEAKLASENGRLLPNDDKLRRALVGLGATVSP